jgi:hypothetical protein
MSSDASGDVAAALGVVISAATAQQDDIAPGTHHSLLSSVATVIGTLTDTASLVAQDASLPLAIEQFAVAMGTGIIRSSRTVESVPPPPTIVSSGGVSVVVADGVEAINSFRFADSGSSIQLPASLFGTGGEQTVVLVSYASDGLFPDAGGSMVGSRVLAASASGKTADYNEVDEGVAVTLQLDASASPASMSSLRQTLAGLAGVSEDKIGDVELVHGGDGEVFVQYLAFGSQSDQPVVFLQDVSLVCGWWDRRTAAWSSEGCTLAAVHDAGVVCNCSHLTNFAVLVNVRNNAPAKSSVEGKLLSIVTTIGCAIAILALVGHQLAMLILCTRQALTASQKIAVHMSLLLLL